MLGATSPDDGVVGIPYLSLDLRYRVDRWTSQNPLRLFFRPRECQETRIVIQARTSHIDEPRDLEGKEDSRLYLAPW